MNICPIFPDEYLHPGTEPFEFLKNVGVAIDHSTRDVLERINKKKFWPCRWFKGVLREFAQTFISPAVGPGWSGLAVPNRQRGSPKFLGRLVELANDHVFSHVKQIQRARL